MKWDQLLTFVFGWTALFGLLWCFATAASPRSYQLFVFLPFVLWIVFKRVSPVALLLGLIHGLRA
ncbi:hypothetical protein [Methylocaldum sp.]|uniref:hypothetical protein n=1 Tax=Methylocaldum sp. TaxID=1969727 RepID=UPI002D4E7CCC|nr:hypothetical protein [Methylocaldum sp.]HYE35507.1 hypothetical protein [Methylocaldum sp.]